MAPQRAKKSPAKGKGKIVDDSPAIIEDFDINQVGSSSSSSTPTKSSVGSSNSNGRVTRAKVQAEVQGDQAIIAMLKQLSKESRAMHSRLDDIEAEKLREDDSKASASSCRDTARGAARDRRQRSSSRSSSCSSTACLLYTSPSPRDKRQSRMPSSA